jgi:outer membrane protein, heavy metal efflux system
MRVCAIAASTYVLGACCALFLFPAAARPQAQSLTVEQAVAEAIQNNPGLVAQRANVSIAEARILAARLRPNPVLSTGGDHVDVLGTGFSEENGGGPFEYTVRTDFLLERGKKRQSRVEVAERSRAVVELEFLDAMRLVALDVQNAAVDVLLAKENLALARENLESANRIVDTNMVRVRTGDIAEVELIRSRVAALQFSNSVRRAELAERAAQTRLKSLLGRAANPAPIAIAGELRRNQATHSRAELAGGALTSRPDMQALRRDAERASAEVRLQTAQSKVDYTVGTEYRRQQGVNGRSNSVGFFLSTELPVFNRNQGEIERARQELRQSEARVRALELAIRSEVESAYDQWEASRDLLAGIEKQMLGEAREVREVTDYSYRRGEATLLELLDAQRAFNETMQAFNEARAEHARSLYLLDAVSGKAVNP